MRTLLAHGLAALLGWWMACSPATATDAREMPAAIGAVFEASAPSLASIGRPGDIESLRAAYAQRGDRPVWFGDEAATARRKSLISALADAGREGLDAGDYAVAPTLSEAGTAQQQAEAEIALSTALIRYVSDLRRGRWAPSKPDRFVRPTPKPVDAGQVLLAAAETSDIRGVLADQAPRDSIYRGLRSALDRYRAVAATGGWPTIPDGPKLSLGSVDRRVELIRMRLQLTGDLPTTAASAQRNRFGEDIRDGVKRFQARHGLPAEGVFGARTREAMNVPVEARIRQLTVNLERARWLPEPLGDPSVLVNLAAYTLDVVEGDRVVLEMRVVVGRPARSTPMFSDAIRYLEFNPYWNVPRTILVQDKLPILRSNPASLTAQGIHVIAPGGARIDPTTVDWSQVSAERFPFALRQDPGERNALGRIKFMFPNPYDIYLHDTPSRGLFSRPKRAYSSGCIRIERPIDLAEFLLRRNDGWDRQRIERAIAAGKNRSVSLATPVPVHLLYLTAWTDFAGEVQFRDDLYNRDAPLVAAIDASRESPGVNLPFMDSVTLKR